MSPADRLVGREPVMAAARAVLADAAAGSGQLLMVSGEAGIGKTAVLAALIDEAGPDARCCAGSVWRAAAPRRTGRGRRSSGQPASRRRISARRRGCWRLGHRRPRRLPRPRTRSSGCSRRSLGASPTLAADSLVLVALDDLQWADESSVRLLGFLARTLAATKVLLLGAFRDAEAPPELAQLASTAQQLTLVGLGAGRRRRDGLIDAGIIVWTEAVTGGHERSCGSAVAATRSSSVS